MSRYSVRCWTVPAVRMRLRDGELEVSRLVRWIPYRASTYLIFRQSVDLMPDGFEATSPPEYHWPWDAADNPARVGGVRRQS